MYAERPATTGSLAELMRDDHRDRVHQRRHSEDARGVSQRFERVLPRAHEPMACLVVRRSANLDRDEQRGPQGGERGGKLRRGEQPVDGCAEVEDRVDEWGVVRDQNGEEQRCLLGKMDVRAPSNASRVPNHTNFAQKKNQRGNHDPDGLVPQCITVPDLMQGKKNAQRRDALLTSNPSAIGDSNRFMTFPKTSCQAKPKIAALKKTAVFSPSSSRKPCSMRHWMAVSTMLTTYNMVKAARTLRLRETLDSLVTFERESAAVS